MNSKKCLRLLVLGVAALTMTAATRAWSDTIDTRPDTWSATDALGRSVPTHEEAGTPREGKFVGMFYFLWMGQHGTDGPYDVPKILAAHPDAMTTPTSPPWGPLHHFHHWGESVFGYYLSDDRWVYRKHAQMLSDAGVDVIIFDVTNQAIYEKSYTALCETFMAVRAEGGRTPQIAFLTPFWDPPKVVTELQEKLYKPGLFRDLWFLWKGKPLIMADPDKITPEQRDFFTCRKPQPDYFVGPTGPNQWGWLEISPQHVFTNEAGEAEQMVVGIAQNASNRLCTFSEANTRGRSWHNEAKDTRPDAVRYGLNFAEQWKRALEVDPEFIFITGWNEWIAMRLDEFAGVKEPVMFCDAFTQEYSRDIEPMKGGHGDDYYYQTVSYIRRFKGARSPEKAGPEQAIAIDGAFEDWAGVSPEFRDDLGDTAHRDHPGYEGVGRYTNDTGRNDIVAAKVARTGDRVFFYVRTAAPLSPSTDPDWMRLYIDADRDAATGWMGFDLAVNRTMGTVEQCASGDWREVGRAEMETAGNEIELAVPRSLLSDADKLLAFDFKWADNTGAEHDPLNFIANGDTAPNGRFTYPYITAE